MFPTRALDADGRFIPERSSAVIPPLFSATLLLKLFFYIQPGTRQRHARALLKAVDCISGRTIMFLYAADVFKQPRCFGQA